MKNYKFVKIIMLAGGILSKFSYQPLANDRELIVLAASSTAGLIHELSNEFYHAHNSKIKFSISSSGILAKQVKLGIPANLIISASIEWIDDLISNNRIDTSYIKPIFQNSLMIVRNINQELEAKIDLTDPRSFYRALGKGKLVIGDPTHVPLGKYTVNYLKEIGIWGEISQNTIQQVNSRAVVNLIDRNEATMGIIYQSDINISNNIIPIKKIPGSSRKIIYYVAIIKGYRNAESIKLYNFLSAPKLIQIYEDFGFIRVK